MDQRLSVVTLGVSDLERALEFYARLGWQRGNAHAEVAFFQLNGSVLSLFSRTSLAEDAGVPAAGSGFGGIVLSYNARSPEDVDAVLAQAEQAGGRLVKPAANAFWGGYHGTFADPDGHLWEVAWNPEWRLTPEGQVELPY